MVHAISSFITLNCFHILFINILEFLINFKLETINLSNTEINLLRNPALVHNSPHTSIYAILFTLIHFPYRADDKNSKRKKAARNRILWKIEDIDDNIPLQVTSREILNCQYGKPPKPTKNPTVKISDHNYGQPSRKRFHVQKSRKVGCPSKVYIRHITRYNAFKLSQTAGQREKQKTMEKLHQSIRSKEADTNPEQIIHVKLPLHQSHKNHKVSIESGFSKPIDAAVRDKIHEYVSLGITSVPLIKRVLKTFVESELCPANQVKPTSNDRAYFPSCHSIQNHVHHALVAGRFSGLDQENLENKVADWKAKEKLSNFFLRKCTSEESHEQASKPIREAQILTERCFPLTDDNDLDDNSDEPYVRKNTFLFIHQTVQQKMLLERYGELVLLDATYRTTKYALPLFLMVVRTNVGYTPVATFICESETTAHIAEALSIIKEWNLQWKPQFFMIDYSETEYQALQDVFPEAHKYVCSFHREQAWIRWCREGKNQLTTDNQHHLLKMLRDIATAKEKEKCDKGIHILRSSKLYSSNIRVKTYTETRWLGICQRWCRAYALPGFNVSVTTNNGVEALNRTLKQFYLKLTTTNTVSSLAETLVLDFIPDQLMSYTRKNYAFSSQYKAYNPQVPAFLHDRPRAFVKHCMTKISAATHYKSKDVQKVGENIFQVKSENSLQWYEVFLGDSKSFPKCQCAAFMENFMPCKHLFAIFAHSDATWNSLSPLYKNSAYFNLDLSFLSKEVQFKSCLRDDQEVGTGSPVQQEDETDVSGEEASTCNRYIHSTQKCLREKLKVLQDLSFLSSDVDVMSNVISQLTLACAELEQTIPRENQLPLHQSGKKSALRPLPQRKKKMKKAKQSKMIHRTDPPPKKRVHFEATGSGDKSSDPPPKKRVHFEATGSGDKSSGEKILK
ncbi:uncharacterized protein [Apostichopus japonicus]|uniref:uncharacterized protein isoform X5 n=1 Tax=Stichopus japonicus TaxID=307972 RepID=UPI003AB2DA4B